MGTMPSWTMIIKANRFNYDFANTKVISVIMGFPGGPDGKETTYNARDLNSVPGLGRSPGGGHGTHSSILAWRIPWTEEPGGLQSVGSQRGGHDRTTKHSTM